MINNEKSKKGSTFSNPSSATLLTLVWNLCWMLLPQFMTLCKAFMPLKIFSPCNVLHVTSNIPTFLRHVPGIHTILIFLLILSNAAQLAFYNDDLNSLIADKITDGSTFRNKHIYSRQILPEKMKFPQKLKFKNLEPDSPSHREMKTEETQYTQSYATFTFYKTTNCLTEGSWYVQSTSSLGDCCCWYQCRIYKAFVPNASYKLSYLQDLHSHAFSVSNLGSAKQPPSALLVAGHQTSPASQCVQDNNSQYDGEPCSIHSQTQGQLHN